MEKEKKQILNTLFAEQIKKRLPSDVAATTLAAQYGMSTSTMSLILRKQKTPSLSTIWHMAEILGVYPDEILKDMRVNLPEGFTVLDE